MDAREKNEFGWYGLRMCAPIVLACVPMFIWRMGVASGLQISITFLLAVHAVTFYMRRPFPWWVLVGLLLSSVITLVILCVGAANAEKDPGSSLRQIGTAYQWAFLVDACLFGLALVVSIRVERRRAKDDYTP